MIAFHIFGVSIAWYGLTWSFAILVGYFVLRFIFQRENKPLDSLVPFIQYVFIFSLLGARLFEMLFYQTETFLNNPVTFFYFRDGGLASHGAMLGTLFAIFYFLKDHKAFTFAWLADRAVIVAILQGAIIRIGNFLNSELYGTITNVPWAVKFVQVDNMLRHPVQLYEFLWLLACFLLFIGIYLRSKHLKPWFFTALFFIVVLSGRVVLEFFKASEPLWIIFSKTQTISLVGIIAGLILMKNVLSKN